MSEDIQFNEMVARVKNALAGNTATEGSEMFPTETSDEIIQIVYERNFMRSLFGAIPMTTRTVKVPKLAASIGFHRQTLDNTKAGTSADESTHTTGEIDLTLTTMIANIPIGNYLIAYGVEGLLTVLRDDIASRLAFNEESLFINGDKEATLANNINGVYNAGAGIKNFAGINDTAGTEQNDYLLEQNGLRKLAGHSVSVSGTFALSHLRSAINKLGVHADNRDELSLIVPRNLEVQLMGFEQLQTVDKYGAGATILSGELGRIYGIRIFATGTIPTNLAFNGKFVAAGVPHHGVQDIHDKTVALLVNNRSPLIGNPTDADRRFNMGFLDEPTKDRFVLIPRQDVAFNVRYTTALCLLHGITTV